MYHVSRTVFFISFLISVQNFLFLLDFQEKKRIITSFEVRNKASVNPRVSDCYVGNSQA